MTVHTPLGDWEPDTIHDAQVQICRSDLDTEVWYCLVVDDHADLSSLRSPGRIRAVKRFAEEKFADGEPVRWVRMDVDTWLMELI